MYIPDWVIFLALLFDYHSSSGQEASRRKDKEHAANYQNVRRAHWDEVARKKDNWTSAGAYYHQRLAQIYRFLVAPGQRSPSTGEITFEKKLRREIKKGDDSEVFLLVSVSFCTSAL